jgi:hypothetical protein
MKIIGFIYRESGYEMVLKGDSCLLNGRKPMFVPDWTKELGVTEVLLGVGHAVSADPIDFGHR